MRRLGTGLAAIAVVIAAYGFTWWTISSNTPLLSREGAWLWPLSLGLCVLACWLVFRTVRPKSEIRRAGRLSRG